MAGGCVGFVGLGAEGYEIPAWRKILRCLVAYCVGPCLGFTRGCCVDGLYNHT